MINNDQIMNDHRIQMKSFFYNLSSKDVGYNVYKSDNLFQILFGKLVCAHCGRVWETSDTECFYCGARNYFLYTCLKCGHHFSITIRGKKCPRCGGQLRQLCLNPHCPTNDATGHPYLYHAVRKGTNKTGGVFGSKGGFHIRHNSCKYCGCRKNNYKFAEVKVIFSLKKLKQDQMHTNNINEVYMERKDHDPLKPVTHYYFLHNNKIHRTSGGLQGIKDFANQITESNNF